MSRTDRFALEAGLLACAYVVAAKVGVGFAGGATTITAIWPPTGIAVAALVLRGAGLWPGVAVGALTAELATGQPLWTAAGIAVGNTLAPLLAAWLLARVRFRPTLERAVDVFQLAFIGGFASMAVSATLGSLVLGATRAAHPSGTWLTWWVGDAIGVVLVAPLILTFASNGWERIRRDAASATALMSLTAAAATMVVFRDVISLQWVAILLIAVTALRFHQSGAAVTSFVVSVIAIEGIAHGHLPVPSMDSTKNLLYAQTLNAAIAITSLALAAVVAERTRAETALRKLADALEQRVRDRTAVLAETQRLGRIGSFSWGARTDTNEWSDELYRIYGMTPGEVPPSFQEYMAKVHPDFVDAVRAQVDAAIAAKQPFEHDYRIVHPSGDDRWVHAYGEPVLNADGDLVGLQGTCQDVTERKRAEETTKEDAKVLAESQRLARIGSFRWDARTRVNTWSDELFQIHGLPASDVAPGIEYRDMIHPDDWERVHALLARSYETLEPYEDEYRVISPDGEVLWIHAHAEPFADTAGTYAGMQGTCQDITERKHAEEAVRASEERFRALLESAPNAVITVDHSGTIVLINDEVTKLFGYEHDELVGKPVDMLLPREFRFKHAALRAEYQLAPKRRPMGSGLELWAQIKGGRRVPVDITLSPVETDDGPLVIAIVQDITERRLAEESMREAYERERAAADNLRALDETKTVFLEAVSHELRTPLTVIVGISSLLQDGNLQSSDPGFPELVSSLDTSARRLQHLLDDLLDLDRLGRGIVTPHRRPTAVAELAARVVGGLDIGRHHVDVDAREVVANIDPGQTERIIENLVANALKHTPPDTPIWVRAEPVEGGVVIVVEDAGPGVPDNIRDTVFAPFVKDTRGHIPGTGIGLSLVLRFAALHGGRAWVTDRSGGGASFHVYMPSVEDAAARNVA